MLYLQQLKKKGPDYEILYCGAEISNAQKKILSTNFKRCCLSKFSLQFALYSCRITALTVNVLFTEIRHFCNYQILDTNKFL